MQKYIVELQDDITGEPADETIRFGLDGISFTIDLSEKNATEFRKALTPYLSAARRSAAEPSGSKRKTTSTGPKRDLNAVREWANAMGEKVSSRGRVPSAILEAYDAAH